MRGAAAPHAATAHAAPLNPATTPHAGTRWSHGFADRHFLAGHPGAGHRQAGPRVGQGATVAPLPGSGAPRPCGDDLQAEASAEAARLESKFTDEDLERLVRSKGVDANRIVPDSGPAPASESA